MKKLSQYHIVTYDNGKTYEVERLHTYWFKKSKWYGFRQWYYFANDDGGWFQTITFSTAEKAKKFLNLIKKDKLDIKKCLFEPDVVRNAKYVSNNFITTIDWNQEIENYE